MTISGRTFGVEIECFNLPHPEVVLYYLRKANIRARDEEAGGHHKDFSSWKLQEEQSIYGQGERLELASRVLKGSDGLTEVRKVCGILQSLGAKVNSTCGLHVHVGNRGLKAKDMCMMLERYAIWEETIDEFVLASRRKNKNSYSQSVKADRVYFRRQLDGECKTVGERIDRGGIGHLEASLVRARMLRQMSKETFVSTVDSGHAKKLDFDSHHKYGTIEFRHHHGSFDPVEVTNWIKFCLNFTETSKRLARGAQGLKVRDTGPLMNLDSRTRKHFLFRAEKYK